MAKRTHREVNRMPKDHSGEVVTLTVEEGDGGSKRIGSATLKDETYPHLIFLPRNAPVGKQVRVKLRTIGRTDKWGELLHKGLPAMDEFRTVWRENPDGTLTNITVAKDWLLRDSDFAVVEPGRPKVTEERPQNATEKKMYKAFFGQSQAESWCEETVVRVIPIFTEAVSGENLIWIKSGEREELPVVTRHELGIYDPVGTYNQDKFRVNYPDEQTIFVPYRCLEFSKQEEPQWGTLPQWLRDLVLTDLPVCPCGRSRYNAKNADGYAKCELCRNEELCERCGIEGKMEKISQQLVCPTCKPYIAAEFLVVSNVLPEAKEIVGAMAAKLLTGIAFVGAEGEKLLNATLNITAEYRREGLLNSMKGYQWYYFTDEAVYGTKFSPSALKLLQYLPQANGNGLVDLVVWLFGGPISGDDYYHKTQINHQKTSLPSLDEHGLQSLFSRVGELVAKRLRGGESARIQAVELWQKLQNVYGEHPRVVEAKMVLEADEQDYTKALGLLKAAQTFLTERQAKILSGVILPDFAVDYDINGDGRGRRAFTESMWAVLPNGDVLRPSGDDTTATFDDLDSSAVVISHGYGETRHEEWWAVHYLPKTLTTAQRKVIGELEVEYRKYFSGNATGWKLNQLGTNRLIATYNGRRDEEYEAYTAMCQSMIEVSRQETEVVNGTLEVYARVRRSPADKAVDEQLGLIADIERQIKSLGGSRQAEREAYEAAEVAWQIRDDCEAGTSPVEDGTVFIAKRFMKSNFKGEERWVFGPFYDWQSDSDIQLVLDPFSHASHELSENARDVLVRVRKKNNDQVHLFERPIRTSNGSRYTKGYFVIPIPSPQDLDWKVVELEEQLAQARTKLAQLRQQAKAAAQTEIKTKRPQPKWEEMSNSANQSHDTPVSAAKDGVTLTYNPFAEALKIK